VPLDRASRRASLDAARLRAREAETRREALDSAIEAGIAAHLHHMHHERETLWVYRNRLIPQAASTAEATLAAYTTGQADFLALLDAERALFEFRLMEAEVASRYGVAAARLARALGLPSYEALNTVLPCRAFFCWTTGDGRRTTDRAGPWSVVNGPSSSCSSSPAAAGSPSRPRRPRRPPPRRASPRMTATATGTSTRTPCTRRWCRTSPACAPSAGWPSRASPPAAPAAPPASSRSIPSRSRTWACARPR